MIFIGYQIIYLKDVDMNPDFQKKDAYCHRLYHRTISLIVLLQSENIVVKEKY